MITTMRPLLALLLFLGACQPRPQSSQGPRKELSPVQQIIAARLETTPFRLGPGLNKFSNR